MQKLMRGINGSWNDKRYGAQSKYDFAYWVEWEQVVIFPYNEHDDRSRDAAINERAKQIFIIVLMFANLFFPTHVHSDGQVVANHIIKWDKWHAEKCILSHE